MGVRQESAMAVLSSLIRTAANLAPRRLLHSTKARAGGYSVQQRPSRWEWDRLKDDIHFYLMLTGVPTLALITYITSCTATPSSGPSPRATSPGRRSTSLTLLAGL